MIKTTSQRAFLRAVPDQRDNPHKHRPANALRLQPDWKRMLRDITSCGLISQLVSNPVASLRSTGEPWYTDVGNQVAWVRGPGVSIAGLTDHWAFAHINRSRGGARYEHLDICDHVGNCLLRLSLVEDSNWSGFNSLRVRQWARRSAPLAIPAKGDLQPALERLETNAGLRLEGTLYENWYDAERLRYPGKPVDASLLAPLLETLVDQICPLNILVGNQGLIQQHESTFVGYRQQGESVQLRSSIAEFSLDLGKVIGARVKNPGEEGRTPAGIRLYDELCRCVAVVRLSDGAGQNDRDLWQTLVNAILV